MELILEPQPQTQPTLPSLLYTHMHGTNEKLLEIHISNKAGRQHTLHHTKISACALMHRCVTQDHIISR